MISSWQETKSKSNYHFDNFKLDKEIDKITHLGKFIGDFTDTANEAIKNSKPTTWETRGYKGEGILPPREDLYKEEYDLETQGYGKDYIITNMNWKVNDQLKKISNLFALDNCMERVHVQMPGQVWNLHIDKLNKWAPNEPWRVIRIFIQLTDWEPGHFVSYGNFVYTQWKAGEIHTFDWQNIPHCTANAGHNPRVTYQLTGVLTEQSNEFINRLKRFETYDLTLEGN